MNSFSNPPAPPSKTSKMCALRILYREIPYMGRLGPRAVPPPRSRQGVLKKKVYKNRASKKKEKKKSALKSWVMSVTPYTLRPQAG